jgi:RNA polymerase sigma-70 factor (ECF subfamily)
MIDLSILSDEQLLANMTEGSEEALAVLFDRYAPTVMGLVLRIVHNPAVAEEIVQETFYRVWDKGEVFQEERGSFAGWLLRIARNQALDVWRREQSRPHAPEDDREIEAMNRRADSTANVAEAAWLSMRRKELQLALQQLPPEQQEIIESAYFRGMTRQEIANETGLALGTVHTRARLALQKLRLLLGPSGIEG